MADFYSQAYPPLHRLGKDNLEEMNQGSRVPRRTGRSRSSSPRYTVNSPAQLFPGSVKN
jgi:hypothetical protein